MVLLMMQKKNRDEIKIKEIFTIPNFKENAFCLAKKDTCKDILNLILALIFIFLGFITFVNYFVVYIEEKINIRIIKIVSNINSFKNGYNVIGQYSNQYYNSNNEKKNGKNEYMLEPFIS